jgi:hypothetical protein
MKKTLLAGVLAGACLTAATVVAGGTPASADAKDCPDEYVCVWGDVNFTGRYIAQVGTLDRPDIGSYMNDLTTSAWNRSDSTICFYEDTKYRKPLLEFGPGDYLANISGDTFNDKISSWRRC